MRRRILFCLSIALSTACLVTPAAARVVVLDPGHGGTNRGAEAVCGEIHEKKLTLALARLVAVELGRLDPDLRVVLTRSRDVYLTLRQRVAGANEAGARLLVSLHYNASAYHTRKGFETFILSRDASDEEAAALAARENREAASAGGGTAERGGGALRAILSDLRQSAAHAASLRLARRIQKALQGVRGKELNRGVRQAGFDVLRGLRMPGVLVEVGFIDHPDECPDMLRSGVQRSVARAVARAIADHLSSEDKKTSQ